MWAVDSSCKDKNEEKSSDSSLIHLFESFNHKPSDRLVQNSYENEIVNGILKTPRCEVFNKKN